jgi:hypothetical protein
MPPPERARDENGFDHLTGRMPGSPCNSFFAGSNVGAVLEASRDEHPVALGVRAATPAAVMRWG